MKNRFYVDLNVLYPYFDFLCPLNIEDNKEDFKNRLNKVVEFSKIHSPIFVISKTVYIEWFQKIINTSMKNEELNFNQFIKSDTYKSILERFEVVHKKILSETSMFIFEWKYDKFIKPKNQTWDHFHIMMRENDFKFLTFDRSFSTNKNDFIFLDKNK